MAFYIILIVIIIILINVAYKTTYNYWNKRGIKGPIPVPIVGNFGNVMTMKQSLDELAKAVYEQYPTEKVVGLYRGFTPILLLRDPSLIKEIMIKDFNYFQDRGLKTSDNGLSDNLFACKGETWKILRQKISPAFTAKKLKDMVPLIHQCIQNFNNYIEELIEYENNQEIRSLVSKYTLDVIGSCAFGLNLQVYSDKMKYFCEITNDVFTPSLPIRLWYLLEMIIPGLHKLFPIIDPASHIRNFFFALVKNVIREREGKPQTRKDFMDIMIELKEQGRANMRNDNGFKEIEINDEIIAAQAFVFYAGGFETSSAAISFLLYELALNQEIQDCLYKEICNISGNYSGEINYESVKDMNYLQTVINETLRKHTIVGWLSRVAISDYNFPGTNITVEKGTYILIPAGGLHSDPNYFCDPDNFNLNNVSSENLMKISQCAFLPFGVGPRNCIGYRFAKLNMMMASAAFLKKFKVEPCFKTKKRLRQDPKSITLCSLDGIWLKVTKRI